MAHKKRINPRHPEIKYGGGIAIEFLPIELLRIERLLKILDNSSEVLNMSNDEIEWLSNALDLFPPELPMGEYEI